MRNKILSFFISLGFLLSPIISLAAPTTTLSLKAIASANGTSLTWQIVGSTADIQYYEIYRREAGSSGLTQAATLLASPTVGISSYFDNFILTKDIYYTYYIKACNSTGCSANYETSVMYSTTPGVSFGNVTPNYAPPQPLINSAQVLDTGVSLTFSNISTSITQYLTIDRQAISPASGNISTNNWGQIAKIFSSTANQITSYTDLLSNLTPATTYQYRISACNTVGCSPLAYSPNVYISAPRDITPPSTPSIYGNLNNLNQVYLYWPASTDNVGIYGYKIYKNGTFLTGTTFYGLIGFTRKHLFLLCHCD
jgi:hypothetical protein